MSLLDEFNENIKPVVDELAEMLPKPVQEDLFSVRDEAVDRADRHANADWKIAATRIVRRLAGTTHEFTADRVWYELDQEGLHTHEPRAMGAIITKAMRDGVIESAGRYIPSVRKENHRRPIMVYRGLL